jgi:hypothetical protein
MKSPLYRFVLYSLLITWTVHAQDSLRVAEGNIRLSSFVDLTRVPFNRTLLFTVQLEWHGELDRYQIHPFENPIVQNFEIIGNASSNRVAVADGEPTAVQEYTFTLKPISMGMGYIEGIIIKYSDRIKDYRLTTNRIEVEVIDPLPEPGSKSWLLWLLIPLLLFTAAVIVWGFLKRKRAREMTLASEKAAHAVSPERRYLDELKTIDLLDPGLDIAESFSRISRILRCYIRDKFDIPALEITTEETAGALVEKEMDAKFVAETEFSGRRVDKSELERVYTLLEESLKKFMQSADTNENNRDEK